MCWPSCALQTDSWDGADKRGFDMQTPLVRVQGQSLCSAKRGRKHVCQRTAQRGRTAVAPVHVARQRVRADHEHLLRGAGAYELRARYQRQHKAAAGRRQVERDRSPRADERLYLRRSGARLEQRWPGHAQDSVGIL